MPKIDNEIVIGRRPEEVWALLGDLAGVTRWVPGVAAARLEGMNRICTMGEGAEIHEEIADFSDEERRYRYEQTVHPLGFERSDGTLAVVADGDGGSRVLWQAEVEFADPSHEAQFLPMLEQGYAEALQRLKEAVERG
jgi:mxaD protein